MPALAWARLAAALLAAAGALAGTPAAARVHIDAQRESRMEKEPERVPPPPLEAQRPCGGGARAGYFGGLVPGGGVEAFCQNGKWLGGVAAYYGSADVASSLRGQLHSDPLLAPYTVDRLRLTAHSFSLEGRYYFYDNSTVSAGLGYTRINGEAHLSAGDGSTLGACAEVEIIFASLAIGTYWTWPSGLYAGADWIGVSVPLLNHYSESTHGENLPAGVAAAFQPQSESLTKRIAHTTQLILVLASVGYRF